jgi:hypothetical protein
MGLDLALTVGEYCPGGAAVKRLTLSDRVRAFVRPRLRERGTSASLLRYLNNSPASHRKLTSPEVSMMFSTGTRRIDFDTLDDVAAFFNVPLAALLGIPEKGDLNQAEQRMVLALRVLPDSLQAHFLAVLETMSLYARVHGQPTALAGRKGPVSHASAELPASSDYGPLSPALERDLDDIRERLDRVLLGRTARQHPAGDAVRKPETRPRDRRAGAPDPVEPED